MNAQPMGSEDAAALLAFERSLRWRHARGRGGAAALRLLLAFVVPVALAAWLLPDLRLPLLGALLAATMTAAAVGAFRGHHTATAALLRPDGIAVRTDGELATLGDELTTWLELHRGRREHLLLPWLGREVAAQLPGMEARRLRQVGRGRFARWRWLLPLLLVLVVAWFLAEWLSPPWPGVLGGGPTEPPPPLAGSTPQPSPGGGSAIEQPQRRPPSGQPPPPPPQADKDEPSPPPEPDGPPPPLLDLPAQQRFLIPEFANDGPTRRVRMHAAETEQGAPIAPQPTAAGQGERAPLPPPSAEQFRRAEEQALQSRHVPEHERAMVRRFFQALREAAK